MTKPKVHVLIILRVVDPAYSKDHLHAVYVELCDCLETGKLFVDR